MTDWRNIDFDPGPWGDSERGPEKDLQDLVSNLDLVRNHFKGNTSVSEATVVRGLIWIDTSSSTWLINISDGNDWIKLLEINTITNDIIYPGGFIAADSIPDGYLNTYHVKDGELDERTISNGALREHHPSSGTLLRFHVASGAILGQNLKTLSIQNKHFGSESISGSKAKIQDNSRGGSTVTELEYREFTFGIPDVRYGFLCAKTGSNCFFESSSKGKTGFKLKSSSPAALKVSYHLWASSPSHF